MRVVITGGGTGGHVIPNIPIIQKLKKSGNEVFYIGMKNSIEEQLIKNENIPFYSINAGKLRRYFDLKNFTDIFRITQGVHQARKILKKLKPDIVFSKGGFVSCPVVWAAWLSKIPVVIHESDITPGLTNKLSVPFAKKICYTFPETSKHVPEDKGILTGIPIRESLFSGNAEKGRKLCGFRAGKPVVVVMGGSKGSVIINKNIREGLKNLTPYFQICHICGNGNIDKNFENINGYKQFEYIDPELPDIFAMADIIVARAGATSLFEFVALKKPNLLIPLSLKASRGDQILNARSFEKQGFSHVLEEENMNPDTLLENIQHVYKNRQKYIDAMNSCSYAKSTDKIINILNEYAKK